MGHRFQSMQLRSSGKNIVPHFSSSPYFHAILFFYCVVCLLFVFKCSSLMALEGALETFVGKVTHALSLHTHPFMYTRKYAYVKKEASRFSDKANYQLPVHDYHQSSGYRKATTGSFIMDIFRQPGNILMALLALFIIIIQINFYHITPYCSPSILTYCSVSLLNQNILQNTCAVRCLSIMQVKQTVKLILLMDLHSCFVHEALGLRTGHKR